MASFSVDVTQVRFAATNAGYKDITITGMPQAGVNCTITGTNDTSFGFRIPGDDQNVYRVYTTSHTNIGTNSNKKTATFKITNLSDSTDYVEVSLVQLAYYGTPEVSGVKNVYDNIYAFYGGDGFGNADLFAEYRTDNSGTYSILYVDGYEGTTTLSESWAYYTVESAYTDTGFKQIKIGATNNYDTAFKKCNITFPGEGGTGSTSHLYQNAYPGSKSGCTSPTIFTKDGGTERVTLNHSSQNVANLNAATYYTNDDLSYTISKSRGSNYETYWDITLPANEDDYPKSGAIMFKRDSTNELFGFTIVRQDSSSGPISTLTVNPTSLTYPASGGAIVLDVTYSGTLTTSEFPSWLTYQTVNVDSTHRSYTITASKNSSTSIRNFNLELSDSTMSLTVPITQEAGQPAENISVSPSSLSFSADAGSEDITLRYGGDTYSVDAKEVYKWTTVSLSDASTSTGLVTGTVSVSTNTSTSSRRGNIYFSSGSESVALPIEQAGISFALSAEPSSLNIPASGGSVTTAVTYTGVLSAASLPSWLSETHTDVDENHRTYTITAASNKTTSSRTFNWRLDDSYNHIWVYFDQAASGGVSLNISPSSNSVSSSSGSVQITVTSSGISNVQYSISDSWITYSGKSGNVYTFNYEAKTSTGQRTGTITFSGGGLSKTYRLTQEGASAPASLSISPTRKTVSGATGRVDITVNQTGIDDLQYTFSANSGFVFSHKEGNVYVFSYDQNTSTLESRTASITFSGAGLSETFTLYQQPQSTDKELNLIPTSDSVDAGTGYVYVTVSVNRIGYNQYNRSIDGSWLSYVSSAGYIDKYSYRRNPTSEERTATVTYTGGGLTKTYTLVQRAGTPTPIYKPGSLKVYPNKLRYYGEGGSIRVSFTNRPEGGIGYEIIYTDGSDWLSVRDSEPNKYVTATKNSGIRRRASIKFYDVNNSKNYVIVPVIQGNIDGYDSIWMDDLYYPENRNESGNYYYRIVNQKNNAELFTGISTIPPGWGGEIGGIDIPRLVDGYIHSLLFTGSSSDWSDMYKSYITVDIYNMTENGYPGVVDATFKYCNDWSRFEKRYDYTRSLNDPINGKGCDNMIIPFCVYYDDEATFSIVDTEKNGNVNTYTLSTPSTPFAMRADKFYDIKKLEYKQDDEVIFSYDMDHCGPGAFIYRNRFGGWDSFLIEGNIIKTDNYTKLNYRTKGEYNQLFDFRSSKYMDEKHTDNVSIDTTYEAYTGWLSDEEAERLVFHLLSSPMVFFQNLHKENQVFDTDPLFDLMLIRITASSAEYKKFRNGKKMVNYLITFEKGNIEKVRN